MLETFAGHLNRCSESFQYGCSKEETPFARHTILRLRYPLKRSILILVFKISSNIKTIWTRYSLSWATTFSGCSGTRGLGVVDCAVVLTVVVVSGVGAGVVVGIRSPA